jgi:hypothetical protein
MSNNNTTGGGLGCSGTLFLIFLVLKLLGLIAWSWWWVFSPIWISILIIICVAILFMS